MKRLTHWFLFYSMLYIHSGTVNANSTIFDEYAWTNRLVIMITDKPDLENKSDSFLKAMFVILTIGI